MSKKTQNKKKQKIIQDQTFGLKNKNKSKTVQKFIKGVEQTVKFQGVAMSKVEAEQFEKRKNKKREEEEKALLNSLYNDVNRLKVDEQEQQDPANTVCPYFKQGLCQKGKKCIYSHDLALDRTQQIDLYVDQRVQLIMNAIGGQSLSELSQQELGKLIGQRQKQIIKGCRSDIVCKFYLEAVEKDKYGWNWSCPNNGDRCKYKHCLPPGYRLKKDAGKLDKQQDINIEQKIDQERNKLLAQNLSSPLVTYQVFMKWKQDRRLRKEQDLKKKKQEEQTKNKNKGQLRTGRQLFTIDPTLFIDDEEAAAGYEQEEINEEVEEQEKQQRLYEEEEQEEDEEQDQNLQKQQKTQEQMHQEQIHEYHE